MRSRYLALVLAGGLAWFAGAAASASLLSKSYEFRPGVTLEVGAGLEGGLRIDSVRFELPLGADGAPDPTRGPAGARVRVVNGSDRRQGVGLALALFDEEGRLLGVASGGSALRAVPSGGARDYSLIFDGANRELHRAVRFQITIESK